MPVDYKRYPPDWPAISRRIRFERAKGVCEWCGARNGALGYRRPDGTFVEWEWDGDLPEPGRPVKIILTVAHLGAPRADGTPGDPHDKMDVRDENLAALCQRCHLNYDRADHLATQARNRRARLEASGQLGMDLCSE